MEDGRRVDPRHRNSRSLRFANPPSLSSTVYRLTSAGSQFLNLQELELHRSRSSKDGDHHLQGRPILVDLLDHAREIREGAVGDPDVLSLFERVLGFRLLFGRSDAVEDLLDLLGGQRGGLLARSDEARHLWRVLDQVPRLVGHLHFDDDVAREELALNFAPFSPLHFDESLRWDANVTEGLGHPHGLDALPQVLPHPLFETGVGVHDVPVLRPRLTLGLGRPNGPLASIRRRHATTPAARKSLSRSQESPASTTKR